MIGARWALTAALPIVAAAAVVGAAGPRPEIEIGARSLVLTRCAPATRALAATGAALDEALELARTGSARIVAGNEAPGPFLRDAADRIESIVGTAADAGRAVARLEQARRAWSPDAPGLPAMPSTSELESIAAQLRLVAGEGDRFAEMRRRAASVSVGLDAALAAVAADDLPAAAAQVADARADQAAIAIWEVSLPTLTVWVATSDAIVDAVERLVAALQAADAAAAQDAADDFAALSDDAATADRGLAIAISEGGAAVAARQVATLRDYRAAVQDLEVAVADVRVELDR